MSHQSTPHEAPSTTASNGAPRENGKEPSELLDRIAELVATWFGAGYLPKAPGTFGSLGAVPLHLVLSRLAPLPHALIVVGVSAAGIWASERRATRLGEKDPQSIVIDEVAGTLIAMGLVRKKSLAVQIAALVLFRFLDIKKPGLIDRVQYAEPPGLGIMADDLLAGVFAGIGARILGLGR